MEDFRPVRNKILHQDLPAPKDMAGGREPRQASRESMIDLP
jgi:hypothetical protein